MLGASAAAIIIAIMVWVAYAWADRLVALLGRAQARIVTRLSAFLLLCIGVQIALNGIQDLPGRSDASGRRFGGAMFDMKQFL